MDLAYYGYLAQTIPPRELARALAVRARRAVAARLERPEVPVTALVPVRVARKLAPATRRGIVRVAGSIMRRQPDG